MKNSLLSRVYFAKINGELPSHLQSSKLARQPARANIPARTIEERRKRRLKTAEQRDREDDGSDDPEDDGDEEDDDDDMSDGSVTGRARARERRRIAAILACPAAAANFPLAWSLCFDARLSRRAAINILCNRGRWPAAKSPAEHAVAARAIALVAHLRGETAPANVPRPPKPAKAGPRQRPAARALALVARLRERP